jgi:hypothetical protein
VRHAHGDDPGQAGPLAPARLRRRPPGALVRRLVAAEAVEIHVRPGVYVQLARESSDHRGPADLGGIRLVVDRGIPACPGFEIHRAQPGFARPRAA